MEQQALNAQAAGEIITGLEHEIGKVIVGQHTLIRRMLTALFAAIPFAVSKGRARSGCGHLLLEGVPGVAKTLTATTLAQAISAKFQRVQLTPDLLPADILGTRVYDAKTSTFRIEQGPVFTNILLADEINRATPKTQSALLEAMQERQVTLADTTFPLDDPFWVLATQNPVEQEGVYTLPEAQLDRFSMMLRVGYPSQGEEVEMLQVRMNQTTIERRVSPSDVHVLREFIYSTVHVDHKILEYIVRLGRATRDPAERRARRSARDAAARHLAALVSAPPGAEPRDRVPARPHLGPARRREGDLLRRDAPPHRADGARAGGGRGRRHHPAGPADGGADPMIPEHVMKELRYIEVFTDRKIRNQRVGTYQSPQRGPGFDFDEHQPYRPGDDVRRIDWNVTARMGAPFVRHTHAEREMNVMVAMDVSRSMALGTTTALEARDDDLHHRVDSLFRPVGSDQHRLRRLRRQGAARRRSRAGRARPPGRCSSRPGRSSPRRRRR